MLSKTHGSVTLVTTRQSRRAALGDRRFLDDAKQQEDNR